MGAHVITMFPFFHPIVSAIFVSIVGEELSLRAYLQPLHSASYQRVGAMAGRLDGDKENIKMSSLGRLWMGSGSEK